MSSVFDRSDFVVERITDLTFSQPKWKYLELLLLRKADVEVARAPDADKCMQPLGMEHGHIGDDKITASSAFDHKSVGPQNGR